MTAEDDGTISGLIGRVRAGDGGAAAELVRRFEPLIRREVRLRLKDRRLARVFESMDVCQSVMASFFVRTAAGQYDLDRPEQVLRLLVTMTRHKVASTARRQYRDRRDARRIAPGGDDAYRDVAGAGGSPSVALVNRETLDRFRQGLSDEERGLADLRSEGHAWAEVAARLGGTAEGRRVQLARAVNRVSREMGLDALDDE